ncbi:MAG TPA: division/cell wall cluster transcriptional repressor MraZ [Thermodesulfobacteriaceae bacterium]|nr:division/cell wall cluster transcriptional repressor MraZ [Thermodesulfobacteriaceae bacterium]
MFRGRSTHVLDSKGRLSIPARFRDILKTRYDGRLIVTNLPSCLAAYPLEEWRAIEEQFSQFRFGPPEVLSFKRYLLGAAVECPIDGQGRILLPSGLRMEAGLEKEVVLSGLLNYFEIWNKNTLEGELQNAKDNFDQYSSEIFTQFGSGQ